MKLRVTKIGMGYEIAHLRFFTTHLYCGFSNDHQMIPMQLVVDEKNIFEERRYVKFSESNKIRRKFQVKVTKQASPLVEPAQHYVLLNEKLGFSNPQDSYYQLLGRQQPMTQVS